MKFENDFKKALQAMPEPEKDKLLLRLLKHDLTLANKLYFELVDGGSVDTKRDEMEVRMVSAVERAIRTYDSPGWFMMELRYVSGDISEHVKITQDKFGEVQLNLRMVALALSGCESSLKKERYGRCSKLCIYVVAKVFNMLVLMQKLHPDLQHDLQKDLHRVGELIADNDAMMRTAIDHGLDVNWLLSGNVPENIAELQKELRQMGFLK
jgi:hypothetical protein